MTTETRAAVEKETGELFGALWKPFDDESFEFSVGLFRKRFTANGFDLNWFKGKDCLDVGCGGGRYCIAMAREGANSVTGVDIGKAGLEDARERAKDYPNLKFQEASVLDLPFEDNSFDFVFCSGILMITEDPEKGFSELCRVLKPGGKIYLLLYASGGVRWPAVMDYRQAIETVPTEVVKKVMIDDDFPANKIRTLMDDLKVPLIDFYTWEYVRQQLERNGVSNLQRWEKGRLDHEENLDEMISDMEWFEKCFAAGTKLDTYKKQFEEALQISREYLKGMRLMKQKVESGEIDQASAERIIIGQGHHRLIGEKQA